jgi:hypothetical protein
MNFPVEHLEDCNYNHYALQLSLYALMIELWFKVKIGRLTILYISLQMQWTEYPVPYMRSEAMDIMKYVSGQRSLEEPIQLATVVEGDDW